MTEPNTEKLLCEACGKEFLCGAQSGKCWCFRVDLSDETLAEVQKKFDGCLCRDCLNSYDLRQSAAIQANEK